MKLLEVAVEAHDLESEICYYKSAVDAHNCIGADMYQLLLVSLRMRSDGLMREIINIDQTWFNRSILARTKALLRKIETDLMALRTSFLAVYAVAI